MRHMIWQCNTLSMEATERIILNTILLYLSRATKCGFLLPPLCSLADLPVPGQDKLSRVSGGGLEPASPNRE